MTINTYKAIQELECMMKILNIIVILKNYFFMHMQKTVQTIFQKLKFMKISHCFWEQSDYIESTDLFLLEEQAQFLVDLN